MAESLTGPGLAAAVLVWSIVLALSITLLSAATRFALLVFADTRNRFRR